MHRPRRMMRRALTGVLVAAALIAALPLYTHAMRGAHGTPPAMAPAHLQADQVIVDKPARRLDLLREGAVIRSYTVSLGFQPQGHKTREGDGRTPEGDYVLDWRNPRSVAHLSLHISYPDATDRAAAAARGEAPGGAIMIHGLLNGWGWLAPLHHLRDWTDGCIAVTNAEMREIWSLVPDGTPIRIDG
ncbi:MAG: L,D-transpeptidase family protein [Paracoccus sp. (in: a-proteobacteria)]|nr:L,D-transpeptidase family protein [Paracoccus sp. (in: a-proteobacteria)]